MGLPYGDVDRVAKLVPDALGITLEEALEQSPELRARVDADGQVAKLIETARRLEGLTRHASTHAAGVVIGNRPLIELGAALPRREVRRGHDASGTCAASRRSG